MTEEEVNATIQRVIAKGYVELGFLPAEKYDVIYSHERGGYVVFGDGDTSFT